MIVELRKISLEDSENLVKWRNNPRVRVNLFSQDELTVDQHINYYHKYVVTGLVCQFVIVADGVDCGTSFLKNIDNVSKKAEFGIFIGEDSFRGKGIGEIATRKTVEYGFESLKLELIYLSVLEDNYAALNSSKKAGFEVLKTIEKGYSRNNVDFDVVEMGLSAQKYESNKGEGL